MASDEACAVFEAMIYEEESVDGDDGDDEEYGMRCDHGNDKDYCSKECRCGHDCSEHTGWNDECHGGSRPACTCDAFVSRDKIGL